MSEITADQISKVAELAHLEFSSRELQEFFGQFREILDYFEQLQEVDTGEVPPLFHALLDSISNTPWREDEVRPSLPREDVISQAPASDGEQFIVPQVIE